MDSTPSKDYRGGTRRRRILIVGAGAIGVVFAHHLQRAGAEVSFLVKPRYAADAEEGYTLHRYGVVGTRTQSHVRPANVLVDPARARPLHFDQVWLCVSSTAVHDDQLLTVLAHACPDAVWVSFQPGVDDPSYLAARLPHDRLVHGMVNFVAYQSPLAGEELWPEGFACYVPPMSFVSLVGPQPHVTTVTDLLNAGGLRAGIRPDTHHTMRYGSAVLVPFVVALECSAWSLSNLRRNRPLLDILTVAIGDVHDGLERGMGGAPGIFAWAQRRMLWAIVLRVAPVLAPFPLETYLKHHFSKVRDQSEQMVDDLVQLCRDNAMVPRALEALRDQWRTLRGALAVDPAVRNPQTGQLVKDVTPVAGVQRPEILLPADLPVDATTPAPVRPLAARPESIPVNLPLMVTALDESTDAAELLPLNEEVEAAPEHVLLEVELEPLPALPEPVVATSAPVLRTVADLDASQELELKAEELFFAAEEQDDVVSSVPTEFELHDLPSVPLPLPPERESQSTAFEPTHKPVVFATDEVPPERHERLSREDFIQTEFATEEQDASLRALKDKLRARFGDPTRPMRLPEDYE